MPGPALLEVVGGCCIDVRSSAVSLLGGQRVPNVLGQHLPDAEPRNFIEEEQPLLMGLPSTFFLKTLSCVKGPGAQRGCLVAADNPKSSHLSAKAAPALHSALAIHIPHEYL